VNLYEKKAMSWGSVVLAMALDTKIAARVLVVENSSAETVQVTILWIADHVKELAL